MRWWILACVAACTCSPDPIAKVVEHSGEVTRDHVGAIEQWSAVDTDADLHLGEAVRTGDDGRARVVLSDDQGLEVEENTIVRFAESQPSQPPRIDIEQGAVEIEAGEITTALGVARIEGRARLAAGPSGLVLEVRIGNAIIETNTESVRLEEGDVLDRSDATPTASSDETEAPVAVPEVDESSGIVASANGNTSLALDGQPPTPLREPRSVAAGTPIELSQSSLRLARGNELLRVAGSGGLRAGVENGGIATDLQGDLELSSGANEVQINTPHGTITLAPETRLQLSANDTETIVELMAGAARAGDTDLTRESEVRLGEEEGVRLVPSSPTYDLTLDLSARTTLHVARPPVRVQLSGTCDALVVQFGRMQYRGEASITAELGRGTHAFRADCDGTSTRGQIRVQRDSARRRLPRTPPRTTIDADGRAYTVLYQNQLPVITLRWRNPPTGPYHLHATRGGRSRRVDLRQATHTFPSGQIREGTTRFRFETQDGQRSRESTLRVSFDNAAHSVFIESPRDGETSPGEIVELRGAIRRGAQAFVDGSPVPLDRQSRFSTRTSSTADSIALRVVYPNGSVHHYLRRLRGSPSAR